MDSKNSQFQDYEIDSQASFKMTPPNLINITLILDISYIFETRIDIKDSKYRYEQKISKNICKIPDISIIF